MKINPNDPAFAAGDHIYQPGLTKLEWTAVQIMAGLASDGDYQGGAEDGAEFSVRWARALFAELEKQG